MAMSIAGLGALRRADRQPLIEDRAAGRIVCQQELPEVIDGVGMIVHQCQCAPAQLGDRRRTRRLQLRGLRQDRDQPFVDRVDQRCLTVKSILNKPTAKRARRLICADEEGAL